MERDFTKRLQALELRTHDHERDIVYLKESQASVRRNVKAAKMDLDKIFRLINQIRWMMVGALLFGVATKYGFWDTVKAFLTV